MHPVERPGRNDDRRFVDLTLTPAGSALMDAVFSETRAWMTARMKNLSPEELEAILKAMPALRKMMAEPVQAALPTT